MDQEIGLCRHTVEVLSAPFVSLLNETRLFEVHTSGSCVENGPSARRLFRKRHERSHTLARVACNSARKERVCHRQRRRTSRETRDTEETQRALGLGPAAFLDNLKPENREQVGVTGYKNGNCTCTVSPDRNIAASIASNTPGNTVVGTRNGLSPLASPKLR